MALVAARTDRGTRKPTNEDACCVEVAKTRFGDAVMAIVCDGVGGLVRGEVASSTVVARFASWFEGELPVLLDGMAEVDAFPFAAVRVVWGVLLSSVNEQIRAYDIDGRDYTELLETLNLDSYENISLSTVKFLPAWESA